jgi:hypothetical protein
MYTVGERSERVDAFTQPAPLEYVQTVDGRYIAVAPATPGAPAYASPLRPVEAVPVAQPAPVVVERIVDRPAPQRTVYRTQPVQERVVVERAPVRQTRSWQKSALVIGGSAASGAAVGGMVDGKKGALIGAALGGGAASIYEAIKR